MQACRGREDEGAGWRAEFGVGTVKLVAGGTRALVAEGTDNVVRNLDNCTPSSKLAVVRSASQISVSASVELSERPLISSNRRTRYSSVFG